MIYKTNGILTLFWSILEKKKAEILHPVIDFEDEKYSLIGGT